MSKTLGFYNFLFPVPLQDPYIRINCMGIEERNTTNYYFDNSERHIGSYLFQYTLSGYGIFEQAGSRYQMLPDQAFFIPVPGNSRYYLPEEAKVPWHFIFILLEGEHVRKYYEMITKDTGNVISLPLSDRAVQTLFGLFRQARDGRIRHPFDVSEIAYRFLCQLGQSLLHSHNSYSSRTQAAIQIMESGYDKIDSVEELALTLHITPSHFAREFRQETGVPPIKYLTNIRLQQATKLLQETALPVSEIAAACGFSSGNYFIKLFKKLTGMTPGEFRGAYR